MFETEADQCGGVRLLPGELALGNPGGKVDGPLFIRRNGHWVFFCPEIIGVSGHVCADA